MGIRQPSVQREGWDLDGKIDKQRDPQDLRHGEAEQYRLSAKALGTGSQLCQVKGVLGVEVENKHGNEHEHAAE